MKAPLLKILLACVAMFATASAVQAQSIYQRDLNPLVQQYCVRCHGGRGGRGGINFSTRGPDGDFVRDPVFWRRAIQAMEERTMPEDAARVNFTEVQRQRMVQLMRQCLRNPDPPASAKDPGPAPLRMLTQYEYACTIRDLLGVTDIPLNKLPGDYANPDLQTNGEAATSPFVLNRYMNVAEDILDALPRERVVTVEPSDKLPKRDAAQQTLKQIQTRAFRRPVSDDDMERLMGLYDRIEALGKPYDETLRITLTGVLASAKFISHLEQTKRGDGPVPIDQYDLASRLSYFIWSSMPDEPLLKLAEQDKLADPAVIEQQVRRMLADPKARALAENFGLQWLGVANLRARSSPASQPATQPLTQAQLDAMRDQSVQWVDPIFRQDKSLLALFEGERGGVLGLSAVQVATAAGERTSPPRRGKWVLERMFGEPISPGLYDTCRIQKDGKGEQGAALRQKLTAARQQENCAVCHNRIDPPGLAMEGFDAFGQDRAGEGDITSLKRMMLARKDDAVRNMVERMLGFALGRPIEPCDQSTVQRICQSLARQDYRSSVLVLEIAQSYPFNYRRPRED